MIRLSLLLAAPFLFAQPALARYHRHHHVEKAAPAAEAPAPDAGATGEGAKAGDATAEKPVEPAVPPVPEPRPATQEVAPASPADAAKAKEPDAAAPAALPEEGKPKESGPPEIEKTDTRLYQTACPAVVSGAVKARLEPPIDDGVCRAHSPYAVAAVIAGGEPVEVKGDVTMNCQMATALSRWLGQIEPAAAVIMKSRLVSVRIGTSFQCRRRYGAAEGAISEHAFADAVDLTGFTLDRKSTRLNSSH